jgi:hypothetical protein
MRVLWIESRVKAVANMDHLRSTAHRAAAHSHGQAAVQLAQPQVLSSIKELPLGKYKACLLDQVLLHACPSLGIWAHKHCVLPSGYQCCTSCCCCLMMSCSLAYYMMEGSHTQGR